MNSTAISRFCTFEEAARRLDATQEQVEDLLRRSVLREFRDGPHRLLRTADVAAIAAAKDRRTLQRGQASQFGHASGSFSVGEESRSGFERSGAFRPRRPTAGDSHASPRCVGRSAPSQGGIATRNRMRPETPSSDPSASIREWFWTGLIQDRPVAIALFSSLVLLALSALAAGAYMLADLL
ncbi:MAG: hypothetical protein KBE65_09125 [Phycisphaerae bacterium]|nr:hypothetical protein [Phycisphaerae bacterium]